VPARAERDRTKSERVQHWVYSAGGKSIFRGVGKNWSGPKVPKGRIKKRKHSCQGSLQAGRPRLGIVRKKIVKKTDAGAVVRCQFCYGMIPDFQTEKGWGVWENEKHRFECWKKRDRSQGGLQPGARTRRSKKKTEGKGERRKNLKSMSIHKKKVRKRAGLTKHPKNGGRGGLENSDRKNLNREDIWGLHGASVNPLNQTPYGEIQCLNKRGLHQGGPGMGGFFGQTVECPKEKFPQQGEWEKG